MSDRLASIHELLGHRFTDPRLLDQACTHASACDAQTDALERLSEDNERLEFLGDALLGAAVAEELYRRHPRADEGALSRNKSQLVSRRMLAQAMESRQLLQFCIVGAQVQAPWPDSVKANLAEGILGAIYLDGGWPALCTAVVRLLGDRLDREPAAPPADSKNQLQALSLERFGQLPSYETRRSGGSDHAPEFTSRVQVGQDSAEARASSRRRAETAAATALLGRLEPSKPPETG